MGNHILTFNPGIMTGDGDLFHVMKASSEFGGITITRAYVVEGGTGGGAGTSHYFELINYGTDLGLNGGTAGGTIASTTTGTAAWTANVPKAFTITAAQAYVDSGEWIVLKKNQQGADSDNDVQTSITLEYVDGVVLIG